ncbi:hypothetical protein D018_3688A, partial [Vibrio parahaemolyticus VP2007-007]
MQIWTYRNKSGG